MDIFRTHNLPLAETHGFDRLLLDYVNGNEFLRNFYDFDDSLAGINSRCENYRNERLNRENLFQVIKNQYDSLGISIPAPVKVSLDSLQGKAYTITTGHQLNVFSGPLYVFYKIASTISLASRLSRELAPKHFIPVYWMATEDHDIAEISNLNVFGKKFEWSHSWKGIAGDMPLDGLSALTDEISANMRNGEFHAELIQLINDSYFTSKTLAEATRKWINALFGHHGLVIVDGNDKLLKSSFADVMKDELLHGTTSKLVQETIDKLKQHYHPQVNPREINLFYIGKGFRERIVSDENTYRINNTDLVFSKEEILKELENHPERFSPNVITRPLYQECVLPNVAYLGGPAEVAYWLELKNCFNQFEIPMPAVMLRSCALIIDHHTNSKLNKLGISYDEIFSPADDLIKDMLRKQEDDNDLIDATATSMEKEFARLEEKVAKVDPTLVPAIKAESSRTISSLKTIGEKIMRARKRKHETEVGQIVKLKQRLFPDGQFQERVESSIQYYQIWGRSFIDSLVDSFDPLNKQYNLLEEVVH